jgi:hypothetical protein
MNFGYLGLRSGDTLDEAQRRRLARLAHKDFAERDHGERR